MRRAPHPDRAAYPEHAGSQACPACGERCLIRIRRRFIDRLLSLFVRLQRFRCQQFECQWEGNLRANPSPRGWRKAAEKQVGDTLRDRSP